MILVTGFLLLVKNICTLAFEQVYESYSNLPAIFGDIFILFKYETDFSVDFDKPETAIILKTG